MFSPRGGSGQDGVVKKVVFVISGGPLRDLRFLEEQKALCQPVSIICADGGARHAYALGLVPDLIIGDMDSLDGELQSHFVRQGSRIMRYPQRKDETDTQLALEMAFMMAPDQILIFGAIGGRLDHTLANLSLLLLAAERGVSARLVDEWSEVFIVKEKAVILGEAGQTVSIYPFGSDASGITLEGFEYPLTDATMRVGKPYGISNRLTAAKGVIAVGSGHLLVVRYVKAGQFPRDEGS
jgi:thiamine pyrophosphokinase